MKLKTPKKLPHGEKSLFDVFQKSEDKRVVGERKNLKDTAVLHYSSEESYGDNSTCSASEGSDSDCKDWK